MSHLSLKKNTKRSVGHLLYQRATESQVNTFPWQSCDTDDQNFLWKAALDGKPPKLTWFVSLILRKCPSNQWAHKRHLCGNRQKAILKVKSILYRLPSTKEASVSIFHDLNASGHSNIYLIYLLLISKKLGRKDKVDFFTIWNLPFPNKWKWMLSTYIVLLVKWHSFGHGHLCSPSQTLRLNLHDNIRK